MKEAAGWVAEQQCVGSILATLKRKSFCQLLNWVYFFPKKINNNKRINKSTGYEYTVGIPNT